MSRLGRTSRLVLPVPPGLQPEAYFAGLLASALFGVAAGTSLFLGGVLFLRTSGVVAHPKSYTVAGRLFYHPEHETESFLVGCALTVGVVVAHAVLWNRRLRPSVPDTASPPARRWAPWVGWALVVLCAGAALAGGVLSFFAGRHYVNAAKPIPGFVLAALLAVIAFCLVAGAVGTPARFSWCPRWLPAEGSSDAGREPEPPRRWGRPSVLDVLVPTFLTTILFIPAWRLAAGRVFVFEQFFHWDFFAMGPAVAYSHGQALGAHVHSEYGIGWPVLFHLLRPVLALSYGHMILVASIVTCAYYVGVYVLLRVVTGRASWAAVGALLAVLLQMFSGNYVLPGTHIHSPAWELPSILVMRRPLDVWVFLALVLHLRTKRLVWAVAGGALTALAVVFSTDTGLYLAAAYLLYWVCVATIEGPGRLRSLVASGATATGVLLIGLGVGSRWTLFSTAFWRAWWEPISQGAQGYTALPMVGRYDLWKYGLPHVVSLAVFVAVVVIYLVLVSHLAIKAVHGRAAPTDVFLGCLSAYGLLTLISFLGRSDPVELPHLYVPVALAVTVVAGELHRRLSRLVRPPEGAAAPGRRGARIALALTPVLFIGALGTALGRSPDFRDYPGPLQTIGSWSQPDGLCLMVKPRDVCGIPAALTPAIRLYQAVFADMQRLSATGRVVVLDYQAQYNVGAGIAPWGPYVPLLDNIFTQDQARGAEARFVVDRPTYVFIRPVVQDPLYIRDVATEFRAILLRAYTLDHTVGPFEVWSRRDPAR
ncbi:MAG: hypothetical protein M3083_02055 [Actinomycetota bacterium]|nr:hypothetical protein [Actinomycetota bacterium]